MKTLFWKRRRPRHEERARVSRQTQLVTAMLKAVGFFLVPLLIFFLYFTLNYRGLSSPDALDTAQLARQIMKGEGFTTRVISPVSFNFSSADLLHFPELIRAPLFPWMVSRFFLVMGDNELVVPFSSGVFFLICSLLTFRLGVLLGGKRTGLISFLLIVTSPALLQSSLAGSRFLLLTLPLLGIFWAINRLKDEGWQQPLACGLLSGAAFLIDYAYLTVALVILGKYIFQNRFRKLKPILIFTVFFLTVISPWLIRNSAVTGNPFFSLQYYNYKLFSSSFPGYTFFRSVGNRIYQIDSSPTEVLVKVIDNLPRLYLGLLVFSQSILFLFYLAGFFRDISGVKIKKNDFLLPAIIILLFLYISVTDLDLRIFLPLIPLIAIGAGRFFSRWLRDSRQIPARFGPLLIAAFIVLNSPVTIQRFLQPAPKENQETDKAISSLAELVKPGELVVSDNPWMVAWKGERTAIWIPATVPGFHKLIRWNDSIKFLFLTRGILDYPAQEEVRIWQEIFVNRRLPPRSLLDMVLPLPGGGMIFAESGILESRARGKEDQDRGQPDSESRNPKIK